ncbi:MAG: DUF493 family protein YbeD [Gammaproteobacteria bacterium]|nr:DUF493 family protein YbeD [Gammaproteobacteria bacterium]NNJ72112.1 DUF493 family protein [Enterobacterales bacterium]
MTEATTEELWQFPCNMTFKAMTVARDGIENEVITEIQRHCPGDYSAQIKPSKNGNYYSVSVNIHFQSKAQVESVYKGVHQLDDVKMVL